MLKKNRTTGAVPKPSAKKPAVKKQTAKPVAKKPEPDIFSEVAISAPSGKKYITINEHDPQLQKKYRLIVIIIAIAVVFLAVSWFFSLRYNVAETFTSFRNGEVREGIDNLLSQFKDNEEETAINQNDLAAIREEIVKKINSSISSSTWPVHQSEILGLTIRYPFNWNKQEITDTLTLSSYPLSSAAPSVFGQVKVQRLFEKKNSLTDYLTAEQKNGYEIDPSLTQLSGSPAIKYVKQNTGTDISWIIVAGAGSKIFKLELFSKNGQGLYEKLFSEILSTIKF